ncbi:hypothetical protein AJ79_05774 [Helicocarpus griseus UAMH5409]|uniref:Uncharacterized protein n=1 Tax=Helicocarpus griseus UAMH5409 TaxID=1447875 RepID=A0A2B7XJD0_9EURO|nr:hypothetical protein AJ79_05774 [Helicocarpus griseus UAMH5409]
MLLPSFIPSLLSLLLLCRSLYAADCPLIGPAFPPPRSLSSSATWNKAIADFDSQLKGLLSQTSSPLDASSTSFSLNIFSAHEEKLLYEYHYDAPGLKGSIAEGQKLDGDTMYRIASVSKAITVYGLLIETGFKHFNEPVANFIPEIAAAIAKSGNDPDDVLTPQWNDITIGSLAGQLSGIGRGYFSDLAGRFNQSVAAQLGLPPLNDAEIPRCGFKEGLIYHPCSREDVFKEFMSRHPAFAPFSTPIYSNVAYDILGYVLEEISGLSFEEAIRRSIIEPLRLERFGVQTPPNTWGVIPFDPVTAAWNASLASSNPNGGFYSSANDLARVGQSILQSRLISPTDTRRWLKPNSHTSSLLSSVGSPWEIYRTSNPRVADFYTKFGDIGSYGSAIALSADHDVGFTVLAAGAKPGSQRTLVADLVGSLLSNTLDNEARAQAMADYAGTYTSSPDTENDKATLIKIGENKDDEGPGLVIDSFLLNGVPLEQHLAAFFGSTQPLPKIGLRMQPTGLKSKYTDSSRESVKSRTAFRVVADISDLDADNNLTSEKIFSGICEPWQVVDGLTYGQMSFDEFVFELDGEGRAMALDLGFTRQVLDRREN